MPDDIDKMFEDFEQIGQRARTLVGNRTVTAYDDLEDPSSPEDGLLPPDEPNEEEHRKFIKAVPAAEDFSRLLDILDVATPAQNRIIPDGIVLETPEPVTCGEDEIEADKILAKRLDRKFLAPAPKSGYYLHVPVDEKPELYTIYRIFRAMLSMDLPLLSVQVGQQVLSFYSEGNVVHLSDNDRTIVYQHEDTGRETDVLIWVANQDGRLGYIFNGWTYRRENP